MALFRIHDGSRAVSAAAAEVAPFLLVVDDDPVNVELLSDLLRAMGYRVDGALSGESALAMARRQPPDLVLLDIMMPGMNGYEVCRRLKADARTARTPVVFVTALAEVEDKVKAIDAGGDDFLAKPFHRPVLLARIRSLLRLKAARDELEQSYRKLQELEQLRDDLMQMVVHDLKSPLAALLATLEMTVEGDLGPLTDQQRHLLGDAYDRGTDALALMDDLLELARLEDSRVELQWEEIEVEALLCEVVREWTVRAEQEGARLVLEPPPNLRLAGDPHLLRRVFGNLVGNAIKHGGPGVEIRLAASPSPAGQGVRFTVADTGHGIPEAYHELVFRKYGGVRLPTEAAGARRSGLGLSFCKLVVEAHGGRIWVRSREGEGASFHFVIPFGQSEQQ